MSQHSTLLHRLENREKVYVTPTYYLKKWNIIFSLVAFIVLTLDFFIALSLGKSFITLGLIFLITVLPVFFIFYLRKHIKSTYMTGDTLILKSFDNSSKVTSLRSVRKIKTTSALGLQWTRLEYNLDGVHNSILIVNASKGKSNSPDRILTEAIDWSKKRKANHKPGPVAV